jgi:hypothetical protein
MFSRLKAIIFITITLLISNVYGARGSLKVNVNLSPAGSFEISSKKVKGYANRSGGGFVTKGIKVKASSLDTGLKLRDDHLHKKLEVKKHKYIEITQGKAKGGKGVAIIVVKGIKKKFNFSYTESGNNLKVKFPLSLKDFNFSGINYAGVGVKDKVVVEASIPIK